MKTLLVVSVIVVSAWGAALLIRFDLRDALVDQQTKVPVACPIDIISDHDSPSAWEHLVSEDQDLNLMLRDYHNLGRNDFGLIRTI